jgi:Tfp pilus assembly protein PilF
MNRIKKRTQSWPVEYVLIGLAITLAMILIAYGLQRGSGTDVQPRAEARSDDAGISRRLPGPVPVTGSAAAATEEHRADGPPGMQHAPVAEQGVEDETRETLAAGADDDADASSEPVSFAQAEASFHAGEFRRAADEFAAYTLSHPHNPWGAYMQALSEWKAGELDAAATGFERALELDPEHVKSLINLGRVHLDRDEAEAALSRVDQALELAPAAVAAHRVRGRALHELGRADEALAAYREALTIDVEDAWSLNNMGLVLIEAERFDEALAPLALATSLRQDQPCFFNNLGVALERGGFAHSASIAYAQALSLDEDYAKARESLARVETQPGAQGPDDLDLAAIGTTYADALRAGIPAVGLAQEGITDANEDSADEGDPSRTSEAEGREAGTAETALVSGR